MKPHRGVLILVLGILSLVGCGIFTGIPAWIMGTGDLKQIDAGTMDATGRGMTNAGRILGMISVILMVVGIVVVVLLMMLGVLAGVAGKQ